MHEIELRYIEYDENMSPKERHNLEHCSAYDLLTNMLKKYFEIVNPTILKTENGKPYIENSNVHFSISHTNGLVACVVSDMPIGVDAEKLLTKSTEEIQKFAKRFFVENEFNLLKKGNFSSTEFFKIWTGKEATIKKHGSTMSEIKKIDITKENLIFLEENGYIISINI